MLKNFDKIDSFIIRLKDKINNLKLQYNVKKSIRFKNFVESDN